MLEHEQPLWSRPWFQRLLAVLVCAGVAVLVLPPLIALVYALQPVLLPVLIGVALAYAVNPLARWAELRCRVPRPVSAVAIMGGLFMVVAGLSVFIVPRLAAQIEQLIGNIRGDAENPGYAERLAAHLDLDLSELAARIELTVRERFSMGAAPGAAAGDAAAGGASMDYTQVAATVFDWLGAGIGVIGSTIGYVTYLLMAMAIIAFVFFFFVWKFDRVTAWFLPFIPSEQRPRTVEIMRKMDASVAGFIRGRLIQATVIGVVLSLGWWMVGVPYWLLLGLAGGVLNLIPFAAIVVWPIALLLTWLDSLTGATGMGFDVVWVLLMPTVVYLVAQGLDGWVVEPIVQGQATNLDPLTVLLVVLVGGSLAGLLGLLIAIPVAACAKILAQEVLLPRLRAWAAENEAKAQKAKGTRREVVK